MDTTQKLMLSLATNPDETMLAVHAAADALDKLIKISELPKGKGAKVKWVHNDLTWIREADNYWWPENLEPDEDDSRWPSEHVISFPWELISLGGPIG